MRQTTRNKLFLTVMLAMGSVSLLAEDAPRYTTALTGEHIRLEGREMSIAFNLDLGEEKVRSHHKRIITPLLRTADGSHELRLPAVVVNGRNRALKELRENKTQSSVAGNNALPAANQDIYLTLTDGRKADRTIDYRTRIAYEPWMDEASFSLVEAVEGCACGELLQAEQLVNDHALYAPALELTAEQSCPVEFTPRSEERDAYLIYPVNKTVLRPELYGNDRELQKIDSALSFVQRNPDYEIRHIAVAGFASPEGGLRHNIRLSEGRAEALKNYIGRRYSFPDTLLTVTPGAENWDGLVEALRNYQLPYKQDVLDAIAKVEEPDAREEAIRQIGGGLPYQTLLHSIYPGLRKNTFTISYISRERQPEKARELVFTHPEELNVHEFYRVADLYYKDDAQKRNEILLIAADTYPNHSIANNNAARICLEQGDLEKAEQYLNRTQNEPFTANNRGILLWKQQKREEALVWWRKAAEAGDTQAKYNLEEVAKRGF